MANYASPTQFADALLADLGAPITPNTEATLTGWARAEGGAGPQWGIPNNIASFNPFNTSQKMPGSKDTPGNPSAPIQAYTSWDQGLQATADTLLQAPYASIVADLRANAPEATTAADVGASTWGTPNFAPGGTGTASATLTDVAPGGLWDPLNLPGAIGGAVNKAGGGAIASGILGVVGVITKPLVHFLEDSTLVLFGIIIFIVGAVLIAHGMEDSSSSSSSPTVAPPAGPAKEGEKAGGKGAEGVAEEAPEAAVAA